MPQTWNDILTAVKLKLGADLNLLEMSDDQIIEGLKSNVVPYISQYAPLKKFTYIDDTDRLPHQEGASRWTYQIKTENYIIDIFDVYARVTGYGEYHDDPFYGTKYAAGNVRGSLSAYAGGTMDVYGGGMIQMAINNAYLDMAASFMPRNTWEFISPNILIFDQHVVRAVIVYNTVHENINSMPPDIYHTMFKPYCIGSVCEWVSALRSKYENLSTPFGPINLNWQKLEQDGKELKQEVQQKLDMLPLDKFIEII